MFELTPRIKIPIMGVSPDGGTRFVRKSATSPVSARRNVCILFVISHLHRTNKSSSNTQECLLKIFHFVSLPMCSRELRFPVNRTSCSKDGYFGFLAWVEHVSVGCVSRARVILYHLTAPQRGAFQYLRPFPLS